MAQPPPYNITTYFGLEDYDTEFNNLKETIDSILENLALIQRNDGKIKDGTGISHIFNLDPETSGFLKYKSGAWTFLPDPLNPARTAQAAAEIAQAAAEAAQTVAEAHRDNAQTSKLAAEAAQAAAEAANLSIPSANNVQSGSYWHAVSTGSGSAYEITLSPAPTAITSGLFVHMKTHVKNTGAATLNVNSLGAKAIKKSTGADLQAGEILADALITLVYDGTNFQLINSTLSVGELKIMKSHMFSLFEKIQENHGGSLLMEKAWSDSFANANEQGADEVNSSDFQHDATNKFYKGTDAGTGLNSDKNYTTESNYIQQEWTNANQGTSQADYSDTSITTTTMDQSSTTTTANEPVNNNSGGLYRAMTFTAGLTGDLHKISLALKKNGSPDSGATFTAEIRSTSSDLPTTTILSSSETLSVGSIGSSTGWYDFTFATKPSLTSGTKYAIVVTASYAASESNNIGWHNDNNTNTYANGSGYYSADGSSWTLHSSYDFAFRTHVDVISTEKRAKLSTGTFPANCGNSRISFDSGSTWYEITVRDSDTQLKLESSPADGSYDYIIRMSDFDSGNAQLSGKKPDSFTKLLLHMDGANNSTNFIDSSLSAHTITVNGTTKINTSQSKFGGSSGFFDGTEGGLTAPDSTDWQFGSGDFTIDFWARASGFTSQDSILEYRGTGSNISFFLDINGGNVLFYGDSTGGGSWDIASGQSFGAISTTQFNHFALVRSGNNFYTFKDGVQASTWTSSLAFYVPDPGTTPGLLIGDSVPLDNYHGYLDELRISKGIARWTANFTPPSVPYLASNPFGHYVSIADNYVRKTNTSAWTDINSGSITETLNSQNAYYWLAFDPAGSFGAGTEIKIFNPTDSVWRVIAKNNSGTWEYNSDSGNSATYTGASATVNDMLHAISQAMSTQTGNRMTGTNLAAITDTQWEETGGWSASVNSIIRGVTLYSSSNSQTPSLSQYRLNYDSDRAPMDLQSKTYDPGFAPTEAYLWTYAEHSDADGPGTFSVTRNGGTEWTTVSMVQQGLPLSGDVRILRGTVDLSGQASGQDLRCRYQTVGGKDQYLRSWGLLAKQ